MPAAEVAVGAGAVATTTGATTTLGGATSTAQTATAASASHGSVAASAGAGKTGIAAKFSALGHAKAGAGGAKLAALGQTKGAAVGGKVAAKGGMKLGGKALLIAHPIGGAALIGATIYIHKKRKKDKVFTDKLRAWKSDQQLAEELTVTEIFELEEDMLIKAEDPEQDVSDEDIDEVIEEKLAEDLELTHITTEPGLVTDGLSCGAETVPAGVDNKRSETIA